MPKPLPRRSIRRRAGLLVGLAAFAVGLSGAAGGQTRFTAADPADIRMVVWRGCEEACRGFIRYFEDRALPVSVAVTDVARDKSRLPAIRDALRAERPDLVVTWGTSVSRALIGARAEHGTASALGDIPALFMIVADPIGADLVDGFAASGRPLVAGVRNRVPEEVQLRLLLDAFGPRRIGVIGNPAELNSRLNLERLRALAPDMGFELIARAYPLGPDGAPDPSDIPDLMASLKASGAEAVYVGSTSFNLQHADAFTAAALAEGLPVFSPYAKMVRESDALMAVANAYANVGKLAASQAEKILLQGARPGDLPVAALERYSILINMAVARRLSAYPPLQLLKIAEIINPAGAN